MAPVLPVGQGGLTYQRPAQHPGVWEFSSAVEEATETVETPPALPMANMPRISLQVQEMLSQPFGAMPAKSDAQYALPMPDKRKANLGPRGGAERRVSDRRARRRDDQHV